MQGHFRFFVFIVLILSSGTASAQQTKIYRFGVVPQQTAVRMAKSWVHFTNYLSSKTGLRIQFATAKNIPAFEKALEASKYDFSYMSPFHYTSNSGPSGYAAFARVRDKLIKGIIVVRRDGQVKSLTDLQNKTVAFPSFGAFGASRVPRSELKKHGIVFTPVYVSSHDSVYLNVQSGNYVAGGGVLRTFGLMHPTIRNQLRILYTTKGYTPHAFAAHRRIPAKTVEKVQKAVLEMESDLEGARLLYQMGMKGIARTHDGDWDDVRHDFPGNPALRNANHAPDSKL